MPFKSDAQRKWMFSQKPEMAKEWAAETPKDKELPKKLHPEKTVKRAFEDGFAAALERFKLAGCGEEIRLKIPRREFHGWDEAWRSANRGEKKANTGVPPLEPQADENSSVERLTAMIQQLADPPGAQRPDATKDPLDRNVAWGAPSNLAGGDTAGRVTDMGQPSGGTAF